VSTGGAADGPHASIRLLISEHVANLFMVGLSSLHARVVANVIGVASVRLFAAYGFRFGPHAPLSDCTLVVFLAGSRTGFFDG